MTPEYVATKSIWKAITVPRVIFFWLIIPLIAIIIDLIIYKNIRIEFFGDKVIVKSGVFTKREQRSMFKGVISVSVTQTIMGRIFDYGDISVDVVGQWDIDTKGIHNPKSLQDYLNGKIGKATNLNTILMA